MSEPEVSIVLPTRNGAATLPTVLASIGRQQIDIRFEVVAVDSGSEDGTADLLRGRVDRLITIPAEAFDHGLSRNLGVEQARGEIIVLLVQDAVPASERWLASLIEPLAVDGRVAGAFGRQRPPPGASPLTRHYLERWTASSDTARTVSLADRQQLEALAPRERLDVCTFDNVCSCIRRSIWRRHPFRSTSIAEDLEWAREVLLAGYSLVYVPAAEVIHSHERSARYEFLRTYLLHRRLYELFQLRTIPTVPILGRSVASSLAAHRHCEREAGKRFAPSGRAIALALAWPLGQYLGGLSAASGWPMLKRSTRV